MIKKITFYTCLFLLAGPEVSASTGLGFTPQFGCEVSPYSEAKGGVILIEIDDVMFREIEANSQDVFSFVNETSRTCTVEEFCGGSLVSTVLLNPGDSSLHPECGGDPRVFLVSFD